MRLMNVKKMFYRTLARLKITYVLILDIRHFYVSILQGKQRLPLLRHHKKKIKRIVFLTQLIL